jgi:hypothetical protein
MRSIFLRLRFLPSGAFLWNAINLFAFAISTQRRIPDGMQGNHHAKSFRAKPHFHLILPTEQPQ